MKLSRILVAVPVAALAACGASDPFLDATPSYAGLAMDQTSGDAAAPSTTAGALTVDAAQAMMTAESPCHPHLFIRSHEVVARVNQHLFRFLRLVDYVLDQKPRLAAAGDHVWERTLPSGVSVRFTMTRTGDVFTWLLELAPPGGAYVQVFWGDIDRTGAALPHQGTGTVTLDLTALRSVFPLEPGSGQVSASFEVTPSSRRIVVDAVGVAWAIDPTMLPDGTDPSVVTALEQPRDGHYVFFHEIGKGGSLKLKDQMVFLCPDNPSYKLADAVVVDRWYRAVDGARHGRADGLITGGQLPDQVPPVERVVGATCQQASAEMDVPAEVFWLMKSEAADGSTIAGWSSDLVGGAGPSACDTALNPPNGTVSDLVSSANDFGFAQATFTTGVDLTDPANQPYPFPGM